MWWSNMVSTHTQTLEENNKLTKTYFHANMYYQLWTVRDGVCLRANWRNAKSIIKGYLFIKWTLTEMNSLLHISKTHIYDVYNLDVQHVSLLDAKYWKYPLNIIFEVNFWVETEQGHSSRQLRIRENTASGNYIGKLFDLFEFVNLPKPRPRADIHLMLPSCNNLRLLESKSDFWKQMQQNVCEY